jgi:hypothetical protein
MARQEEQDSRTAEMTARIYKPARTATQSGKAKAKRWLLEFEPQQAPEIEPLMGWTSSADTRTQVRLWFATEEEAVAYAQRRGLDFEIEKPAPQTRHTLSYSDNFKTSRIGQWTH